MEAAWAEGWPSKREIKAVHGVGPSSSMLSAAVGGVVGRASVWREARRRKLSRGANGRTKRARGRSARKRLTVRYADTAMGMECDEATNVGRMREGGWRRSGLMALPGYMESVMCIGQPHASIPGTGFGNQGGSAEGARFGRAFFFG
jgi:hypothetical protein